MKIYVHELGLFFGSPLAYRNLIFNHFQGDPHMVLEIVPFALLIDCVNPPPPFVFKLSKNESYNLRVFRPTPRHWLLVNWVFFGFWDLHFILENKLSSIYV